MARLPQPGADDGVWGSVLNDYLSVALASDGTVKPSAVGASALQDDSVTEGKLNSGSGADGQVLTKDSGSAGGFAWTSVAGSPDATTSTKGLVRLAGDLGGTAASPTVPGLANAEQTVNKGAASGYAGLNSSSVVPTAQLGSGSATSSTFLRGDNTWAAAPVTSVASKTGAVTLVKGDVGLGNVDNTSDANKPVSTAQQAQLDLKADLSVTDSLDTRVDALESAGIVNLSDGASIATDASTGKHFRVTVAGDRTLAAPTNPTDGMRRIWEITASGADRSLTLATGSAGSFELTTNITSPITITNGKTQFIGAVYNSTRNRWTVLASQATS